MLTRNKIKQLERIKHLEQCIKDFERDREEMVERIKNFEQEREEMVELIEDLGAGQCECCRSWTMNRAYESCECCEDEYYKDWYCDCCTDEDKSNYIPCKKCGEHYNIQYPCSQCEYESGQLNIYKIIYYIFM